MVLMKSGATMKSVKKMAFTGGHSKLPEYWLIKFDCQIGARMQNTVSAVFFNVMVMPNVRMHLMKIPQCATSAQEKQDGL